MLHGNVTGTEYLDKPIQAGFVLHLNPGFILYSFSIISDLSHTLSCCLHVFHTEFIGFTSTNYTGLCVHHERKGFVCCHVWSMCVCVCVIVSMHWFPALIRKNLTVSNLSLLGTGTFFLMNPLYCHSAQRLIFVAIMLRFFTTLRTMSFSVSFVIVKRTNSKWQSLN